MPVHIADRSICSKPVAGKLACLGSLAGSQGMQADQLCGGIPLLDLLFNLLLLFEEVLCTSRHCCKGSRGVQICMLLQEALCIIIGLAVRQPRFIYITHSVQSGPSTLIMGTSSKEQTCDLGCPPGVLHPGRDSLWATLIC